MKNLYYTLITATVFLAASCNKEKAAINEARDATKDAIDTRKAEVEADADYALKQTDANAQIDKAVIEADKLTTQAQLDAKKKQAEAEADAAKAKVDANSR